MELLPQFPPNNRNENGDCKKMIIVITKYCVKPNTRNQVLAIAKETRIHARKMSGNVEYMALPSIIDDEIISIEEWDTKEQLERYCSSDVCNDFLANRAPYLIDGSKRTEIYEADLTTINVPIKLD